jgi:SUMO ligase MMS21 Smc5/6 complex component
MLENSYKQQYERMLRYLNRIEYESESSIDYDDDLWAFFQACWHLKDWIKNDNTVDATVRNNIEQIVKMYPAIMISADLANATKHLKLTTPRAGADIVSRSVVVNLGDLSKCSSSHGVTLSNGTTVIAQEVAKKAVEEWQEVLKNNGLI